MTPQQEKTLCEDVGLIKQAVLGNEQLDQHGLVHKVTVLEAKQAATDKRVLYASGFFAAIVLGGKMAWDWWTGVGHK